MFLILPIVFPFIATIIFTIVGVKLYGKSKIKGSKSKWKYPPEKRFFQFMFSLGNLLVIGGGFISLFPFLLLVSVGSTYRMLLMLVILLIALFSIVSMFRPKFVYAIPILYLSVFGFNYLDNPKKPAVWAYKDICNELRDDVNCTETASEFSCQNPSKHGEKKYSKELCINKKGMTSELKFRDYKDSKIGKTYVTKKPLLILKNLPRVDCRNRACGYKYDARLEEFKNNCSNCLDDKRVTTKLRLEYLPAGSKLKVVDSYIVSTFVSSNDRKELVVESESGIRAETSELGFKLDVIGKTNDNLGDDEKKGIAYIQEFMEKGYIITPFCSNKRENLYNFIRSFRLEKEIEVIENTIARSGIDHFCQDVRITTMDALLLKYYYEKEWYI